MPTHPSPGVHGWAQVQQMWVWQESHRNSTTSPTRGYRTPEVRPSKTYEVIEFGAMHPIPTPELRTVYAHIHHHRPGFFWSRPGAPDTILGDDMAGAVVVDQILAPAGPAYYQPHPLRPFFAQDLAWSPGGGSKATRAEVVDIGRLRNT